MSKVSRHELAGVIIDQLKAGNSEAAVAAAVADYLVAERRTKELDGLMREVMELRAAAGHQEVTALSAFPLADDIRREIRNLIQRQYPESKSIILHEEHDPEAIGGVRIETNDLQLDVTVKSRLRHLSVLADTST